MKNYIYLLIAFLLLSCNENPFINGKGHKAHKIQEDGHFVWGTNVVKHSDGLYYSFNEKWEDIDGFKGWVHHCKIYVSDASDSPLGPFENYKEISTLRNQDWSSGAVTNLNVVFHENLYYLFYVGTSYDSIAYPVPTSEARKNQRIGVATAKHPKGPWEPYSGNPIVSPREDYWDQTLTVNPYVWRDKDSTWRMVYKSDLNGELARFAIGMVESEDLFNWTGKEDAPNFSKELKIRVEDPAVWQEGDMWYAAAVDFDGSIVGERQGILLTSHDGINFQIAENESAWQNTIQWSDNTTNTYFRRERPFVLVEDGEAKVFTSVFYDGSETSFNIAVPIIYSE